MDTMTFPSVPSSLQSPFGDSVRVLSPSRRLFWAEGTGLSYEQVCSPWSTENTPPLHRHQYSYLLNHTAFFSWQVRHQPTVFQMEGHLEGALSGPEKPFLCGLEGRAGPLHSLTRGKRLCNSNSFLQNPLTINLTLLTSHTVCF